MSWFVIVAIAALQTLAMLGTAAAVVVAVREWRRL